MTRDEIRAAFRQIADKTRALGSEVTVLASHIRLLGTDERRALLDELRAGDEYDQLVFQALRGAPSPYSVGLVGMGRRVAPVPPGAGGKQGVRPLGRAAIEDILQTREEE